MSATALRQTEAQFQQAIVDLARALGWLVYHPHDSRHSAAGFPDLTLVRGTRLIFAELKSEAGRLSASQRLWLDTLLGTERAEIRVWRPGQWDEIVTDLRRR